jgi:UDP-3-O-acyl N-acetylglucosamine deacetylase
MIPRRTIASSVELSGAGLFTAKPAKLRLRPLPAGIGRGIVFRRAEPAESASGSSPGEAASVDIPARIERLAALPGLPGRNTVLAAAPRGPFVVTTEHVLSALAGLGVTDCLIELVGDEVPMFDGSASPFTDAILRAGVVERSVQSADEIAASTPITLAEPIKVEGPHGSRIVLSPRSSPGASFSYTLDYTGVPGAEGIVLQTARWGGDSRSYMGEIAPARTFCLVPEATAMREAGLMRHVTPRDMLVLDSHGVPVENELRFDDEPARHKLLDLIGDLALVGRPIQADIAAFKSGHALNHEAARRLLAIATVA